MTDREIPRDFYTPCVLKIVVILTDPHIQQLISRFQHGQHFTGSVFGRTPKLSIIMAPVLCWSWPNVTVDS